MPGVQRLARAGIAVALIAALLAAAGSSIAVGQEAADCEVTDLGTLGSEADSALEAVGRWTTEDCDSRFRAGSDAHTYRFHVAEAGRVRVGLTSPEADSYLYLLTEDGSRIADNDDNGERLDARVESDLAPGAYLVEATTVGGRDRGPADFTLTVSRVEGCDFVHLGTLEPGVALTASGAWSLETCGSRFVSAHPAHSYSFDLAEVARVRIDLESENGDPVLSLASLEHGIIGANDDGGEFRNARIDQYLQAGIYLIEATTYLERDLQPLQAEFTLTVHVVDEAARQQEPRLKIEEVRTPAEVVAGAPFPIHYRIGNVGGELPDDGRYALIYVAPRRVFDLLGPVSGIWDAGVAYHTGDEAASASSTANDEVTPFEATLDQHGPSWLFVGVVTEDADRNELGFHGLWHNLVVLSGPTFGPVDVRIGFSDYTVAAEADSEGEVTAAVTRVSDPDAEVDPRVRMQAVYTAGVLTQILDGIFERPAIAELSEESDPERVHVANPSSSNLIRTFGQQYAASLSASGLTGGRLAREAINPAAIEELWLDAADAASSHYASMAANWRSLLDRAEGEPELSFRDARTLHSQLGYAESIVAPAVAAGDIITAARSADEGWEDPDVQEMMAEQSGCRPGGNALRRALEAAGIDNIDDLLDLDAEMRLERPVHGLAVDQSLCAAAAAGAALSQFLRSLSLDSSAETREMLGLTPPEPIVADPEPHRLRIVVRLADDGRLEDGVQLADGERILPPARFLPADAPVGSWRVSGDVEVDGNAIGKIRARRVAGGRSEVGFVGADGTSITPDIAFLPADASSGVWYRSSEIEVPAAAAATLDMGT
ncbi:MAG: PPC domain-containing protein [Acidimicrobiaceae bacterium]|nr:PPC domain-containing protein [Acidimicrobiaceae bacterium]